ncbi:hypothetical protein ASB65_25400 [Agrobacterium tumefaciens str. B6]|nr:hypothetical protein ASB65_25400 [Agrobacterium tumefaciens str. B6]OCJ34522.1 hypothetical protein A6U90_26015 [Agrobacterium tumefaciens]
MVTAQDRAAKPALGLLMISGPEFKLAVKIAKTRGFFGKAGNLLIYLLRQDKAGKDACFFQLLRNGLPFEGAEDGRFGYIDGRNWPGQQPMSPPKQGRSGKNKHR